jgi:hypothetical protein
MILELLEGIEIKDVLKLNFFRGEKSKKNTKEDKSVKSKQETT